MKIKILKDGKDREIEKITSFEDYLSHTLEIVERNCVLPDQLTETDFKVIEECNKLMNTGYHLRENTKYSSPLTQLSWVNGSKRWIISRRSFPPEQKMLLQGNEIVVPFSPQRLARIVCYLNVLPLYYASFNAKMRGEVSLQEALEVYAEGRLFFDKPMKDDLILNKFVEEGSKWANLKEAKKELAEKGWGIFFGHNN